MKRTIDLNTILPHFSYKKQPKLQEPVPIKNDMSDKDIIDKVVDVMKHSLGPYEAFK